MSWSTRVPSPARGMKQTTGRARSCTSTAAIDKKMIQLSISYRLLGCTVSTTTTALSIWEHKTENLHSFYLYLPNLHHQPLPSPPLPAVILHDVRCGITYSLHTFQQKRRIARVSPKTNAYIVCKPPYAAHPPHTVHTPPYTVEDHPPFKNQSPQLYLEVTHQLGTNNILDVVHLFVRQRTIHTPVGHPIRVRVAVGFLVGELCVVNVWSTCGHRVIDSVVAVAPMRWRSRW